MTASIVYRSRNAGKLLKEAIHLQNSLQTKYIGNRVMWFKNLSSTQGFARRLISMKGMTRLNGYVIISDRQQNGIGRHGNTWISPKGGIWLSIILSSTLHPSRIASFSFCASVAVSEAIDKCTGIKSRLKWPNDVMIEGKKVSVKDICERHILEDYKQKFIPTVQDFVQEVEMKPWMQNGNGLPDSVKKLYRTKPTPIESTIDDGVMNWNENTSTYLD